MKLSFSVKVEPKIYTYTFKIRGIFSQKELGPAVDLHKWKKKRLCENFVPF